MEELKVQDNATSKGNSRKPSVSPKILELFSSLAHKESSKRVSSSLQLVRYVSVSEEKKEASAELGRDARYTLNRLVRGLASSRPGAREGFFTALVHLLRRVPEISTETLLSTASAQLPDVQGDQRQGTEHRLGRLLAAGAAVRAGRWEDELAHLTAALLKPWKHRSYMPPIVVSFIAELVQKVSEERFAADVWPQLCPLLSPGWTECTPERLWMLLSCRRQFPDVCDSKFLKQHWGSKKMFSSKSYEKLSNIIKSSAASLPEIHPVVTSVMSLAVERPDAELVDVCKHLLEPLLEDRNAALLAMAMLQMIVPHLSSPELAESVLTPAVVGTLVQLLPRRDQQTEQAARGLGSALVSLVLTPDTPAQVQLAILRRLLSPPGLLNFDFHTGTKIVVQMINGLKAEALEPFAEIPVTALNGPVTDQNLMPRGRAVACDMLCRLVQHQSTPGLTPLKQRLLLTLFTAGAVQNDDIPEELAATALRAFFRALDHPVRRLADLTTLLRGLADHQDRLLRDGEVQLRTVLSPEARAAWDAAASTLQKLEADAGPDTDVFVILLGHLSQQLFGSDSQTAQEALQELQTCLQRQRQRRRSSAKRRSAAADEPHWNEVVADLLLMLLSLNVHLLRSVVRSVFTLLAPQLSREAVMHVFQSLNPEYKMDGNEDDDEEDGEEDDSDAESDEEEEDEEEEESSEEEDTKDDSDVEDEEQEEENGVAKNELDTLRSQVKSALGDDSDDDVSIDMDAVPEEHFAKLDAALAAAFQAMRKDKRGKRGGKQSDGAQALMHFRIRVLDLADVYVRVCPRAPAALDLLPVLLALLSHTASDKQQAPLTDRLRACVGRLTSASGKLADGHQLTPALMAELLTDVLQNGARLPAVSLELGGLLSGAVRFLVRTAAQLEADQTPVVDALSKALDDFFTERECVYPQRLFAQLLQLPSWPHGWRLVPSLLSAAFDDKVRLYRRTQALQLVTNATRNAALVAQAPADDVRRAAAQLWRRLEKVLAAVSGGDDVKSKYLSSSLEALLSLRLAVSRSGGSPEPAAETMAAGLQAFIERVPVNKALKRLAGQLGARRTVPAQANNKPSPKKQKSPATSQSSSVDDVIPTTLRGGSKPARRSKNPAAGAEAPDADRDGSVDSGVVEEGSDREITPTPVSVKKNKKKRRKDAESALTPAKKARV